MWKNGVHYRGAGNDHLHKEGVSSRVQPGGGRRGMSPKRKRSKDAWVLDGFVTFESGKGTVKPSSTQGKSKTEEYFKHSVTSKKDGGISLM